MPAWCSPHSHFMPSTWWGYSFWERTALQQADKWEKGEAGGKRKEVLNREGFSRLNVGLVSEEEQGNVGHRLRCTPAEGLEGSRLLFVAY